MLSSACGAAPADPMRVDPANVQWLGIHCEAMTVDDITIDTGDAGNGGYLHIDLRNMEAVAAVFAPKECTFKIPFTIGVDRVQSSVTLSGSYTLPESEQIMTTVGVSRAGTVADAGVYKIKHSPAGEFSWKQPFEMEVGAEEENTLKIVISLLALPPAAGESEPGADHFRSQNRPAAGAEVPVLSIFPLRLTVSHVVESPPAAR